MFPELFAKSKCEEVQRVSGLTFVALACDRKANVTLTHIAGAVCEAIGVRQMFMAYQSPLGRVEKSQVQVSVCLIDTYW